MLHFLDLKIFFLQMNLYALRFPKMSVTSLGHNLMQSYWCWNT